MGVDDGWLLEVHLQCYEEALPLLVMLPPGWGVPLLEKALLGGSRKLNMQGMLVQSLYVSFPLSPCPAAYDLDNIVAVAATG